MLRFAVRALQSATHKGKGGVEAPVGWWKRWRAGCDQGRVRGLITGKQDRQEDSLTDTATDWRWIVCHAVLGHEGEPVDVVQALQDPASFVGHVSVPFMPPVSADSGAEGALGSDSDIAPVVGRRPQCDAKGFRSESSDRGGGGLRMGTWQRRGAFPLSVARGGIAVDQGVDAGAAGGRGMREGEDECPLVVGGWEWRAAGCAELAVSGHDCEACWAALRRVRFIGDSNCRDIYVEAATCVLGDWDPELPVARAETKHSNASVPLASGRALDFKWCTRLAQVTASVAEFLAEVEREADLGLGSGGRGTFVVLGFSMWDIVVHLTPLEAMVHKLEPLLEAVQALQAHGVGVVWLSPIPRTLAKRGVLPGERDVRVSYWRVRRWAVRLARLFQDRGVSVVDSYHAAAALPEAFDGNHLGIACGWGAQAEWIGTHAGRPGVCRWNGRVLARSVLKTLVAGLCPTPAVPARRVVRVLPLTLEPPHQSIMVPGLVRRLRFSLLDGWEGSVRRVEVAGGEDAAGAAERVAGKAGGAGVGQGDGGRREGEKLVYRRGWAADAIAEVRVQWCKLCGGAGRSESPRSEGAWELSYATVMFDDVPLASCLEAHCTVLLPHLAPGKHTMTLTFFDTDNLLVSSVGYALNVPLVDAMARNVAAHAHGGSALAAFSQEQFDVSRSIDGVATGHANGWAYHGRLHEAEAMYRFSAKSRVRRVVLLSGVGRPDHHLTHAMIYYSTSPDPRLADDSWFELPLAVDPVHLSAPPPPRVRVVDQGRVMMENGVEEVRLECDFVAATAIKLIVLGSDAANGNAVVTEVEVWAV